MPITYDDDPNTLVPTDLTVLSLEELLEFRNGLKQGIQGINDQIYTFNRDANPEHMQTLDWRRRAAAARRWYKEELSRLKLELTRRHQDAFQAKLKLGLTGPEAEKQRQVNIAKSLEDTKLTTKAFVNASKTVLNREAYLEIWRLAREMFPEAFAGQTAETQCGLP